MSAAVMRRTTGSTLTEIDIGIPPVIAWPIGARGGRMRVDLRQNNLSALAQPSRRPANAGTHTPRPLLSEKEESSADRKEQRPVVMLGWTAPNGIAVPE